MTDTPFPSSVGSPTDAGTDSGAGSKPADPADAWARAQGHAVAVASLLDDPSVPPWTAVHHLRCGFRALTVAAGVEDEPADAIERSAVRWVPAAAAASLRMLPAEDQLDEQAPDLPVLRELAGVLAAGVTTAGEERFAPGQHASHRRQLWRWAAMLSIVLSVVVVALVLTVPDYREGPWRGEYFASRDFTGDPVVRRDGDVKFDWKRMGPEPDFPTDDFSIRWDSCMVLEEPLMVSFQLVSDDGSRLSIDGTLLVDNWGRHGERSRGEDIQLTAGVHHLRVEYFDARHAAKIRLKASLRGERPTSIPVTILRYPGEELDPSDPCAAVRSE
ncbi:MAG: hypothetical protein K0V04_22580 [Deltaproteobacteria bacterium]|nr:hypothetical protein [Deltaproteobacteria bacterium]